MDEDDKETIRDMASHLDYCGYGDNWERECADASKLPERVAALLKKHNLEEVDAPV